MSRELEALENIKREAGIPYFSTLYDIDMWREDFKTVETALKALEIIKERKVEVLWLINKPLENYNKYHFNELSQEEYDLLKEVIKE